MTVKKSLVELASSYELFEVTISLIFAIALKDLIFSFSEDLITPWFLTSNSSRKSLFANLLTFFIITVLTIILAITVFKPIIEQDQKNQQQEEDAEKQALSLLNSINNNLANNFNNKH